MLLEISPGSGFKSTYTIRSVSSF